MYCETDYAFAFYCQMKTEVMLKKEKEKAEKEEREEEERQ